MICSVLIGGIIGSGKTELIKFVISNRNKLFGTKESNNIDVKASPKNFAKENEIELSKVEIHVIAFDELCSHEDQKEICNHRNGWRNFRLSILDAAEHYICSVSGKECHMQGPLCLKSFNLLKKLKEINSFSNKDCTNDRDIVFLVEDNFYYRSMRYEWFQIARRGNWGFCQIFLTCPLKLAIKRNSERNYNIPESRIKLMHSAIEYPDPSKNRWEKFSLLFDNSEDLSIAKLASMVHLVHQALQTPGEIIENGRKIIDREICSKNVLHQADKSLRKIANAFIKDLKEKPSAQPLEAASIDQIINVRQKVFGDLKYSRLELPVDLQHQIRSFGLNDENGKELENVLEEFFKLQCSAI